MEEKKADYHVPVLLKESIEGLEIKADGLYVDLTFGGGGHTREILKKLDSGMLYAFDQDPDAAKNAAEIKSSSFTFIDGNFRYLKKYLRLHGVTKVDGILADLGISSWQIDTPDRGFSTRFDGALDMRMDKRSQVSAFEVVNEYSEPDLHKIFGMYGEVKNAKTLASAIVSARAASPIRTISELKKVLGKFAQRGRENKYFAQVFQALRIEVNEEMKVLEEMLLQTPDVIKPSGRLVVLSYHSLEDRLVKNFIGKGKFSGEVEKDIYGNELKPFRSVTRKPVEAGEEELARNNRSRSAKLRIAERI
jgi:16S rRNA (cytosine1402-N4)-methyltransferase